jgi:hypothetical protein
MDLVFSLFIKELLVALIVNLILKFIDRLDDNDDSRTRSN